MAKVARSTRRKLAELQQEQHDENQRAGGSALKAGKRPIRIGRGFGR